ncbi:MAG: flagellar motor switch protein FliG [Rickettsiales bacterium]|nr:flagellar motor switch protein FliG [Rickettsiales bacterium]
MAKNSKDSYASLSGTERAAVFMLTISEENVAKIYTLMEEDEIKQISHVMSTLGSVKAEIVERIINEFTLEMSESVSFVGNMETTERLLVKSLGKEKVDAIMEEIRGPAGKNTWEKLANVNEETLASFLKNEYPQTVALVMTKIAPAHAAKVLSVLPEDLTFEVIMRMLTIDSVKKEMLDGIERTLRAEFINNLSRTQKLDSNELMAEIFNNLDRTNETKYMGLLEERDPESAEKIKNLMFTFDDLVSLDGAAIQTILRKVDKSLLPIALKGASEGVKQLFFDNMSSRASKILEEDIESLGPVRLRDVDEAQNKLISATKELAAQGQITIDSGSKDELVY